MKPFILEAVCSEAIWAGSRLSSIRNRSQSIGAWWEVSAHPNASSTIKNDPNQSSLLEVIQSNPDDILGKGYTLHEMLRCGYLDTNDNLSIQVHPNDAYAKEHANDYGKYESWYIVDADPGATLVAGTTTDDATVIAQSLQEGHIDSYLKKWPVKKGDYITIPTGMLHALGKGILAFEIGTNSDTTYRFYDYDRTDSSGHKRPLHIKESFDVTDFSLEPSFVPFEKKSRRIGDTPYFCVDEFYCDTDTRFEVEDSYFIVTNIENKKCILRWEDETLQLEPYESVLVPYISQSIVVSKDGHVLVSRPKKGNKE